MNKRNRFSNTETTLFVFFVQSLQLVGAGLATLITESPVPMIISIIMLSVTLIPSALGFGGVHDTLND